MIGAQQTHEIALLLGAGSGEDFRAQMFRELDRGDAHAAGAAVDEHPLTLAQARELMQRIVGGEERGGHRGRGRERPGGGLASHGERAGAHPIGKGGRCERDHGVTGSDLGDADAHARHDARYLHPQGRAAEAILDGFVRQQAHRVHHVAKVQARSVHLDLDVVIGHRRRLRLGVPHQIAKRSRHRTIELHARAALIDNRRATGRLRQGDRGNAGRKAARRGQQDLILGVGAKNLLRQVRSVSRYRQGFDEVDPANALLGTLVHRNACDPPERGIAQSVARRDSHRAERTAAGNSACPPARRPPTRPGGSHDARRPAARRRARRRATPGPPRVPSAARPRRRDRVPPTKSNPAAQRRS